MELSPSQGEPNILRKAMCLAGERKKIDRLLSSDLDCYPQGVY